MSGRKLWERVAEPSCQLVHFAGVAQVDTATLCGQTDWLGHPDGDGKPTDAPVSCLGCLAVARFVLERGLPAELRK